MSASKIFGPIWKRGDNVWMDGGSKVSKTLQTSLVVDPPDGRIPPLTPEILKALAREAQALTEKCAQPGQVCPFNIAGQPILADGPEDRPLMERCALAGPGRTADDARPL